MNYKLILGLILAGTVLLFIIQNVTAVELTFLFWTLSMSKSLVMLLILSIGIVLGWLASQLNMYHKTHPRRDVAVTGKTSA